jgi:hypothetical protein
MGSNAVTTREETMTQHIYTVHPVECQPQWYNDEQPKPFSIRYAPHIGLAILAISAGAFVLFVLAVAGLV